MSSQSLTRYLLFHHPDQSLNLINLRQKIDPKRKDKKRRGHRIFGRTCDCGSGGKFAIGGSGGKFVIKDMSG
jgi:hypothetical protein